MIDLHSHILPGIDDGAKHWEEALEMARQAVRDGINTIVATPHHQNGIYFNSKDSILDLVNNFNNRLENEQIPITILPGHETHIFVDFLKDLKNKEILTINANNKYIFLELPFKEVPRVTEQLIYDIQLAGYIPIIPHPERNIDFQENPTKLYQLIKKGALSQITVGSLLGYFGKDIHKFTLEIIDHNLSHMIASDAHNAKGHRTIQLKEAYQVLERLIGKNKANQYKVNAKQILLGNDLYVDSPMKIQRKKKLFGVF